MTEVVAQERVRLALAEIARLADEGSIEEYLRFFDAGAVWRMPVNPRTGASAQVRTGRAEIGDAARARRATGAVGPGTHTEHRIIDTSISFDSPDTARAVSRWEFVVETDVAPRRTSEGRYVDVFRLVEGDWLLAERTISVG